MAYKDKQREANAERQRRYKAKHKGVTSEGVTDESITFVTPEGKSVTFTEGEDDPDTPKRGYIGAVPEVPGVTVLGPERELTKAETAELHKDVHLPRQDWNTKPKRGKDNVTGVCCIDHAHNFTGQMTVMERLFYRPANKLGRGETNFVSLPGRACYGVV